MATKTKKPTTKEKPVWLKYTEKEIKDIVLNLAKKDPELTSEKIGLILRDTYGIPKVKLYGLKIGKILKEANLYKNPNLKNITKKVEKLETHLKNNKQDKRTGRSLIITKAKLKKTKEYLAKKNK
jgi:ribosomal protein S15P/S13E